MLGETEKNRISKLSDLIFKASRKVKILRHIAWSEDIRNEFFNKGCSEIPKVNYPKYDPSELNLILAKTEKLIGIVKAAKFPFKDPVPRESPIIKVTPIIANIIATYPRGEIFSFKKI